MEEGEAHARHCASHVLYGLGSSLSGVWSRVFVKVCVSGVCVTGVCVCV